MRDWLIKIRRHDHSSLQTQIRESLVAAILDGQLERDEPVPSTRRMAKVLGVSRNTVVIAYQALLDDGYLVARERSGYYVSEKALDGITRCQRSPQRPAAAPAGAARRPGPAWETRFTARPALMENISKPLDWQSYAYPFIYGQVDHDLFPIAEWRDCARQALGRRWLGSWTNDTWDHDDPLLVEQIRRRLLPRRGILASEQEILITLGAQNALYLLARLLVQKGTPVAMEEPGFPDARNIFALREAAIEFMPIDPGGAVVGERLPRSAVVFVTPSHQFPTTVTMPIERRLQLLELASRRDLLVIEDDYEFETNYVGEPCPALKSLDEEGRVIYVGSLSKTLFPGLRLGFMVAPRALIDEARALRRLMIRHTPNNNQRTAALFLSLGHHDSLIRRLHRTYGARWLTMGEALHRHLPGCATIPSFGGTSVWVKGPEGLDAEHLAQSARQRSVFIEPGRINYARPPLPCSEFRLGFSSIEESRIEDGIRHLAQAIAQETVRAA
ncbi:MAG TPA: PLP-dependent aminotransferase family protein [Aestuariivirgaceae bacterium]|nr:PLP-dependent aminotransferase family protein [Aestuariivirgaceae bacterium]